MPKRDKPERYLYIEQDSNNALRIQVFRSEVEAIIHSKNRIQTAIRDLLGERYAIPPEHYDKDGFIEHFCRKEEVSSSEWAWYVYDGICNTVRGYIEKISLDDKQEEEDNRESRIYRAEEIKRAYYEGF